MRVRSADSFARDLGHSEHAGGSEREGFELNGHQAASQVFPSREPVNTNVQYAGGTSHRISGLGLLDRWRLVQLAPGVSHDHGRIPLDDGVGGNRFRDERAGLDDRTAADDDTLGNDRVLADHGFRLDVGAGENLRTGRNDARVAKNTADLDHRKRPHLGPHTDLAQTKSVRMDRGSACHPDAALSSSKRSDRLAPLTAPSLKRGSIHESSWVSPQARLGDAVTVGPFSVVHDGVEIGSGATIGSHVVLGEPTADFYHTAAYTPRPCQIGRDAVIRSHSVIYAGATIGDDFECGHYVNIREGTVIGDDVRIGTLSDLQGDLSIGSHSRLHSNVFVPQRTTIEEFVWIFPHAVLTNDPHPPSDSCTNGPTIRRYAVVAANATIMSSVDVGEGAVIGAKSLVRSDVPAGSVVVGVPGRIIGSASDVLCRDGRLKGVYPWWRHFRRGYPDGVLPPLDDDPS